MNRTSRHELGKGQVFLVQEDPGQTMELVVKHGNESAGSFARGTALCTSEPDIARDLLLAS